MIVKQDQSSQLDNPVWNALSTSHASFAEGNELAKRYPVDVAQLAAMAGEGFRFPGFTEVSAVCTHPDYRGRGYGSSLVSALVQKITERGETPFLHFGTDNAEAIRVYEKLGFKNRLTITFVIVKRE